MTDFAGAMAKWGRDPLLFVRQVFQVEPDPWQADVLDQLLKSNRICLKASKGVGKSCLLSWIIWHFLLTRPDPRIAVTSATADNLADGLWTELAKWQNRSAILRQAFVWTKTRITAKQHPETWWASARTWSKTASATEQADALAGLHEEYMLFVIDEAGGVPDSVGATAEAALAVGKECRLVISGNPTQLEGPLYRACTSERHLWQVHEVSGDPDNPKRAPRVDIAWARQQIEKFGRDNPWVKVNVFGEFPPASANSLLGPEDVSKAMRRILRPEDYEFGQMRLGVDTARFGDDATVIYARRGLKAGPYVEMRGAKTEEIAGRVALAAKRTEAELVLVDGTGGYGAGVVDALRQMGVSVMEVNFSGKAIDARYFNKRAEMWYEMSEWVKRGGQIPNDPELARDLVAPHYTFQAGKIKLEEKADIKARLGNSPDRADSLGLTFAIPDQPRRFSPHGAFMAPDRRQNPDYDPLAPRANDYDPFRSPM